PSNPGNTQAPAQAKRTIGIPGAVNKAELGLKPVSARGQRNWNGEVAGAGMQVGREFFAEAVECPTSFGKRDDLAGDSRLVSHWPTSQRLAEIVNASAPWRQA